MSADLAAIPVTALKGVGPKLADKLARLGIASVQDLLFHLPLRYQDRTRLTRIGRLRAGQEALFTGTIELCDIAFGRRRSLVCRLSDGTGTVSLRFFHFSRVQQTALARGTRLQCFGEARFGPTGLEFVHPEYHALSGDTPAAAEATLTPVYPATEGLSAAAIRRIVERVLDERIGGVIELLPEDVLAPLAMMPLAEALLYVHRPPPNADVAALLEGRHPAQQRLAFEELLAHHLSLRRLRARMRAAGAPVSNGTGQLRARFLASLPFAATSAQQRVIAEIAHDLRTPHPMQRLVQGDVGSGKTVVAAAAAFDMIEAGWQVAMMAPTELLAEQHFRNVAIWCEQLGLCCEFLAARATGKARTAALGRIADGSAQLVVGTHALFQEGVGFARLGLIIVDEQHRFGVAQRLQLREKGAAENLVPHQLVMTATPIPRTIAQTLYADLDLSVIDELPPGRTPVETVALNDARRADVVERVHAALAAGRQAYWVCPLIEESEELHLTDATGTAAELTQALPEARVGLVHGRMKPAEKDAAMRAFKEGKIRLLVATTVIEVGVDVPNASLMIIEHAERLGLAQLHQLRGRVGRGATESICVLLYRAPLSQAARERIAALRETNDGFVIAQKDLEMRGPGELLGTRQTGEREFFIADLVRDAALMPKIERTAHWLAQHGPDRIEPLIRRWLGRSGGFGHV